jgi:nucleotide-binding universal stress UspA family protein
MRIADGARATLKLPTGRPTADRLPRRHEVIDLIVMGHHGRTGVTHMLMGSVAEHVAHGALSSADRATPRTNSCRPMQHPPFLN